MYIWFLYIKLGTECNVKSRLYAKIFISWYFLFSQMHTNNNLSSSHLLSVCLSLFLLSDSIFYFLSPVRKGSCRWTLRVPSSAAWTGGSARLLSSPRSTSRSQTSPRADPVTSLLFLGTKVGQTNKQRQLISKPGRDDDDDDDLLWSHFSFFAELLFIWQCR